MIESIVSATGSAAERTSRILVEQLNDQQGLIIKQ
jgi:hypothetical protein